MAADTVGGAAINNPKRITVREVSNGVIVDLTNKRDWNHGLGSQKFGSTADCTSGDAATLTGLAHV